MPCYKPLQGWRSRFRNESGKRSIVFKRSDALVDMPVEVPCGQCIGCRLERSRQWAMRCVHEASLHKANCFLTLTYSPEFLPSGGTLVKRHFQLFLKRLRKRFSHKRIRYFHCGEYGEEGARPHYHAIIFGFDFPDKVVQAEVRGNRIFTSAILDELWGKGFCTIGSVTFESAAYVARYVMKKVTGEAAEKHYESVILETGEVVSRLPEYVTMSLKPAIGAGWYDKFSGDVFPSDEVIIRGRPMKPPAFYFRRLEAANPDLHAMLRGRRVQMSKKHAYDNLPHRLRVREKCKEAQTSLLKRKI